MPLVKMPTGEVVDMPDNPTPEQLAALARISGTAAPRSGLAEAAHRAGVLGRGVATGVAGSATMLGDALNTAINMGGRALGHDPKLAMPSEALQRAMTGLGVPQPENTTERVVGGLAAIAGGSRDPLAMALTTRFPPPPAPRRIQSPRNAALAAGQRQGYAVPPSAIEGARRTSTQAERLANKSALGAHMAIQNQSVTDRLARNVAGLPADSPITEDALNAAMTATYTQGYAPIANLGNITTGGAYRRALDKVAADFNGVPSSFPATVDDSVRTLVNNHRVRNFDAGDAINAIRNLRQTSDTAFRAGNTNLGNAARGIASAIENNIELNLTARGQAGAATLSAFRDARKTLAQQNVVKSALERGTGNINAHKIAGKLKRAGEQYLTGDLATIGNFAANAAPVTRVPTMQSVPIYDSPVRSSLLTLGASALGGMVPASVVAGTPLAQSALRTYMTSPAYQRALMPGLEPGLLAQLMRNPAAINAAPATIQQLNNNGLFGQQ